jgi:nicotinate dehydrogenase subunit A
MATEFTLNGKSIRVDVDPGTSLLEVLRNDLELNGAKFGCGLAQCGACAVIMDAASIRSCVTPVSVVSGREVTTLEGLGDEQDPHPLQSAFIEEQAIQCGYCASGIIMTAAAFLADNVSPSRDQIAKALSGHLCRCGAQPRMINAVERAARRIAGDES